IAGTPTATGTLIVFAIGSRDTRCYRDWSAAVCYSHLGSFTMTAGGVWTYTLDNSNAAVQALNVGGTLTDTFTVTSIDGTAQLIKIGRASCRETATISEITTRTDTERGRAHRARGRTAS